MTKAEYSAAIAPLILFPVGAAGGSILIVALWQVEHIYVAVVAVLLGTLPVVWFLPLNKPIGRSLSYGVLAGIFGATIFLFLGWRGLLYFAILIGLFGVATFAVRRGLKFAFEQAIKAWRKRKAPTS
jgi:hypothetical protein